MVIFMLKRPFSSENESFEFENGHFDREIVTSMPIATKITGFEFKNSHFRIDFSKIFLK